MSQSRTHSLIESLVNIGVGVGLQFGALYLIAPWFGWHPSLPQMGGMTAIMTALSLVRSFALRRLFNRWHPPVVAVPPPYDPPLGLEVEEAEDEEVTFNEDMIAGNLGQIQRDWQMLFADPVVSCSYSAPKTRNRPHGYRQAVKRETQPTTPLCAHCLAFGFDG